MKNLKKLFLSMAVGLAAFTSCSKEEEPTVLKPSVTATAANATVAAGGTVTITVAAMAPSGNTLTRYEVLEQVGTGSPVSLTDENPNAATKNEDFSYPVPSTATPGSVREVIFRATDNAGQIGEAKVTITVAGGTEIKVCGAVRLGNQNHATLGSFYATTNCATLKVSEAKATAGTVDFAHFFHASNAASISSPDDVQMEMYAKFQMNTWSERRKTTFKRLLPGFKFAECNSSTALQSAYQNGPGAPVTVVGGISKNDVIAFRTQDGKHGIMLVGSISGSVQAAGSMDLTVKLQN